MHWMRRATHVAMIAVMSAALVIAAMYVMGSRTTSVTGKPGGPAAAKSCDSGTAVHTSNGPICGIRSGSHRQWLGIRYAAAPVGALRWSAPQRPERWHKTFAATTEPQACPQDKGGTYSVNEDCLKVDVTAPDGSRHGGLPVIVHLHGGGFLGGSNGMYPGGHLADVTGAVVVGVQYRLGVLGFLSEASLGRHSGNYGLQDQQAALRWVHRNIRSFGGDPDNVTLLGESAGASSVCDQMTSPAGRGLFHKAVVMSGFYNALRGATPRLQPQDCGAQLATEKQAQQAGQTFADQMGCHGAQVAACLRQVPVDKIIAATSGTTAPIVDGATLPMQVSRAFATGGVHAMPVLLGVDRDENLMGTVDGRRAYERALQTEFGQSARSVLREYPARRFPSAAIAYRTVSADANTVCPMVSAARTWSSRMPTYTYVGENADAPLAYFDGSLVNGAHHIAETSFLFPYGVFKPDLDANQRALAGQVSAAIAAFVRTGRPTADGAPEWPSFGTRARRQHVMLWRPAGDSHLAHVAVIEQEHHCALWDSLARG